MNAPVPIAIAAGIKPPTGHNRISRGPLVSEHSVVTPGLTVHAVAACVHIPAKLSTGRTSITVDADEGHRICLVGAQNPVLQRSVVAPFFDSH